MCPYGNPINTDSQAISLTLNSANCAAAAFGGPAVRNTATNGFDPIRFSTCADFTRDLVRYGMPLVYGYELRHGCRKRKIL